MNRMCVAAFATLFLISFIAETNSVSPLHENVEESREPIKFLTSEESDRLIYHHDESVIEDNIRDLPRGAMFAPEPPLRSVPPMDPPLPSNPVVPIRKTPKGFRSVMETASRMLRLKRRPRMKPNPIPQYRSRPSALISTTPDELEMAFKRIEIMASRVGLNMSSMPRRTQMKVIKKLTPKLPPRMSDLVRTAVEGNDVKIFEYLPEPARDPLVEDNMEFINSFGSLDSDFNTVTSPAPQTHHSGLDISSISITEDHHEDGHSTHRDFEDLSTGLVPPKYDSSSGYNTDFSVYTLPESENPPSSYHDHHEIPMEDGSNPSLVSEVIYLPSPSPLVSHIDSYFDSHASSDPLKYSSSEIKPQIFTRGNKALKISSVKNATPFPRVITPAKEKVSHKPIRVSIISKDSISMPESTQKETSKEAETEVVRAKVIEVKQTDKHERMRERVNNRPQVSTSVSVSISSSKEVNVNKEPEKKVEKQQQPSAEIEREPQMGEREVEIERQPEIEKQQTEVLIIENEIKPTLILDTYKSDDDPVIGPTADPFDLTSEEIAATVAELKKYEDYNSLEYSYLAPHPLEYPDHPDHPKSSSEELFNMDYATEVAASTEDKPVAVAAPPQAASPPLMIPVPMGGGSIFLNPQFMTHQQQQQQPGSNNNNNNKHPGMMRRPVKRPMRPMRRPMHKKPFIRPLRINNVEVKEMPKAINKECDYFSDDLCLLVQDYPIEAISEAIDASPLAKEMLVKEPEDYGSWVDGVAKHQEKNYNFKHYFGTDRMQNRDMTPSSHRHRDFAGEGGFLCPSKVAYGKIKKARSSSTGKWKFIVNYGDKTQTLRLEKCLSPGNTCSYVMPHYRTACTQVHNYHRLLAWDHEKGLHMDVFKAPVTCTCHVQGYYIPGQSHSGHNGQGFTPISTRRRDLPPKLNFAPPRTPMGRGGRKIIPMRHFQNHLLMFPKPPMMVNNNVVAVQQATAAPKAAHHVKVEEDDLHDLLQQYSNLRERIAKRKTERQGVVSSHASNATESLRPKTREYRYADTSTLKQLKKLKIIIKNIKYNNTAVTKLKKIYNDLKKEIKLTKSHEIVNLKNTTEPEQQKTKKTTSAIFKKLNTGVQNGNSTKKDSSSKVFPPKMSRQRLIHHLKRNPKLMELMKKSGKNQEESTGTARGGRSRSFLRSLTKLLTNTSPAAMARRRNGKRGRALDPNTRSAQLSPPPRQNSTQEILRRKALIARAKQRLQEEKQNGAGNSSNSNANESGSVKNAPKAAAAGSGKRSSPLTTEQRQRLRLSVNRPSKVNYSYHPIMDYYFGTGKSDKDHHRT